VASDFRGGCGRTSFITSPRPGASDAAFARGAGAGSVRKTAGAGAGEEFSAGRVLLFGGSLAAIFSGAFGAGATAGCGLVASTGFATMGGSLFTEAEADDGWLRKLKSLGMAKISPAKTAAPSTTGTR